MTDYPTYGFVVEPREGSGAADGTRRVIPDAVSLLSYFCEHPCDRTLYLSTFCYDSSLKAYSESHRSTRGYEQQPRLAYAPWLWADIDSESIDDALASVLSLLRIIVCDSQCSTQNLLVFFSGSKGFHLGIHADAVEATPSTTFRQQTRRFWEGLARDAKVKIDTSIYDAIHPFRAPNTRHAKTGAWKRRIQLPQLLHSSAEGIRQLATTPDSFSPRTDAVLSNRLRERWRSAIVRAGDTPKPVLPSSKAVITRSDLVNRQTHEFISEGAKVGERQKRLWQAAANLVEYGASYDLCYALLYRSAAMSGLDDEEIETTIAKAAGRGVA